MKELFLTIEQSKHLQELGLDMSDAIFCWMEWKDKRTGELVNIIYDMKNTPTLSFPNKITPTYTLQEILKKFPPKLNCKVIGKLKNDANLTYGETLKIDRCADDKDDVFYSFHYGDNLFNGVTDKNPIQSAYKMLCN